VGRRGFTLIEVLVVVAIIALLVAILLPSLARARMQAQGVVCKTNMKALVTALHVYVGANQRLPGTADVWWTAWEDAGKPPNPAGNILPYWEATDSWLGLTPAQEYPWGTLEQQQEIWDHIDATVPQGGSLWRYARDEKIYLCPRDKKGIPDPDDPAGGGGNGRYSYTVNGMVGFKSPEELCRFGYVTDFEVKEGAMVARDKLIPEGTRVTWSTARMMLLYEEHPWNNTNHGFVNDSLAADSYLALRHDPKGKGGRANFGYLDGHVDSKRYDFWGDKVNRAGVSDAKLQGLDILNEFRFPYSYDGNKGGRENVSAFMRHFAY
jgi:prepilin-type N-terminal cleavage/methylation domain-containing protein/prepilin-type processing-associated H-X9-DG protein